jgi:hypothetical protein
VVCLTTFMLMPVAEANTGGVERARGEARAVQQGGARSKRRCLLPRREAVQAADSPGQ